MYNFHLFLNIYFDICTRQNGYCMVLCTLSIIFLISGGKLLHFNKTFQLLKAYFIHFNNISQLLKEYFIIDFNNNLRLLKR